MSGLQLTRLIFSVTVYFQRYRLVKAYCVKQVLNKEIIIKNIY